MHGSRISCLPMMQFPKLIQLPTPDMKVHETFHAVIASTCAVCLQTDLKYRL